MPGIPIERSKREHKAQDSTAIEVQHGLVVYDGATKSERPAFPLAAYLWPAKGTVSLSYSITMILLITTLFRWTTSLWAYSGKSAVYYPTPWQFSDLA